MTGPVAGTGDAANNGGGDGGAPQGAVQASLFTQDQVNAIAAKEKRGALNSFFKELGFDQVPDEQSLKEIFNSAAELKKIKDGQKGDVERLQGEVADLTKKVAEVPELKTTILRQQLAAEGKLPVKFWKFVEGSDEDAIKDSIKELKEELGLDEDGADNAGGGRVPTGTGARPPAPVQQQGRTNGSGAPSKTLAAGRAAYEEKHGKKSNKE
ncbi:scaffolding protein [Mycobacterium phage LittleLaf]|uniref:Scaffolding protein n=14 Tax=Marvinvirus TaxID=1982091 RepID=A0A3S9U907_9CAUD|nr:head scaffolding protein [Mycobacterium phage MosMoris]YP_009614154.1 head scaffolding protein [Mycobacterium phage Marvin]ANM46260.1 scaffolding protein [Mycobacterium phage Gattaca]AVE00783.1 scaffolding protein [Mycobacterium phage Tesla]AYB69844.1 scaffolding protein [Mycobacterium phage LittleLaf]AYB70749.1 scaffolding protein [Mycobacterium phage VasuNzinga]AZF93306.1 scaffolding protein [Mycobacterium phage Beelzebub]AZS06802.1 scaffolding protein [Mycobacterium phage Raela]QAX930